MPGSSLGFSGSCLPSPACRCFATRRRARGVTNGTVSFSAGSKSRLLRRLALDSAYYDEAERTEVPYVVANTGLGLGLMYLAGGISGLLGIGSGVLKVPAMDLAMHIPMKVLSATSNLLIGLTAAASAVVYFSRGDIDPLIAGPVAIGVLIGATQGARLRLESGQIVSGCCLSPRFWLCQPRCSGRRSADGIGDARLRSTHAAFTARRAGRGGAGAAPGSAGQCHLARRGYVVGLVSDPGALPRTRSSRHTFEQGRAFPTRSERYSRGSSTAAARPSSRAGILLLIMTPVAGLLTAAIAFRAGGTGSSAPSRPVCSRSSWALSSSGR